MQEHHFQEEARVVRFFINRIIEMAVMEAGKEV
jgi:hypothetical protein